MHFAAGSGGASALTIPVSIGDVIDLQIAVGEFTGAIMRITQLGCTPPAAGDWIISEACTLTQDATAPANVIAQANVTLTIAQNVTLNVDFLNFHVKVKDTGKLVIKSGAKVD